MKKVFLAITAIILLGLVVGVGYIKSIRQKAQTTTAYEKGKQERAPEVIQYREKLDSLSYFYGQREVELAESIWLRELAYRSAYDSLAKIIDLEKSKRDSSKSGPEVAQARKEVGESSIDSTKNGLSRHKQILSYYKKRYQALPKDLSPYEKRVALAEIREQTAQKFSISLQELDNIRTDSKLDY